MRRSVQADTAALQRVRLNVEAGLVDLPRLIPLLHRACEDGFTSRGGTGPGSSGGHTDLSDRIHILPDGTIAQDPAEHDLADIGRALQLLLNGATLLRRVCTSNLQEPASANWCRGGACPDGAMAAPGKAGRCYACSQAWYRSASNPKDRKERGDPRANAA